MNVLNDKKQLDLNKVRDIIFRNIDILINHFGIDYHQDGDNIFMCCPIHEGSDNPHGLSISISRKQWRCWTRGCHEHNGTDIFSFIRGIMEKEGSVSFSSVLSLVCKIYNINSNNCALEQEVHCESELRKMVNIFNQKIEEDQYCNFDKIKTSGVSKYFEARGFSSRTLKHFGIADCNDKASKMYQRSIVPVHSLEAEHIGFIARSTKDYILPKYIYSEGFKKSQHLYNHHRAINSGLSKSCLFIVEGQGDVWRLYEAGVENCVGLFGRDISRHQQSKLIRSGVTTLVILTDNDQAGRESKVNIKRSLGRMFDLRFPKMTKKDIGDMSTEQIKIDILENLKGLY
jgi:5S rRNA maturation endonuclease (ribonuclease M5)